MSGRDITFDDFSSSKKRQQRITQIAVCIGIALAVVIAIKLITAEKQDQILPGTLAKVESVTGKLMIKRGADTAAYEPGFIVLAGDMIQTIGESSVMLSYLDDGTRVSIGPDVTIVFNGSKGGKKTNLSAGTVVFEIPEQPQDRPMVLASYNADAIVRKQGTYVQTYSGLETHFEVKSGQLQVRRYSDGQITDVSTGQTHTCKPDDMSVIKFEPEGLK
jgi:ferric-dicitrate binding protein FerR (iron transport regulator)